MIARLLLLTGSVMAADPAPSAFPEAPEEDSAAVREDPAPEDGWSATASGSVWLGSEASVARGRSFAVRALGSRSASRLDRGWIELRPELARRRAGGSGTWSVQACAAPLVGIGRDSPSDSGARALLRWREGWVRAGWSSLSRWDLTLGSAPVDPGTGLSFHPTLVLPWKDPGRDLQEPERCSPLGIGIAGSWGPGRHTALQAWPTLRTSGRWRDLAEPQELTVRAEHSTSPFEDHHLQLVAGLGSLRALGAGWEWGREGRYLSAAGAVRDDGPLRSGSRKLAPRLAVQAQRDLPAPLLGLVRLSAELAWDASAWSPARARREAARIDSLASIPLASPQAGPARRELASIATETRWIDAYSRRILLRIGSVESLRWGGGLNLLLVGPQDGAVVQLQLQRSIGDRLEAETEITGIAWCRPSSLLAQMPSPYRGRLGLRWNW